MSVSCLIVYRTATVGSGSHRVSRQVRLPLMIALEGSPQLHFRSTIEEGEEDKFSVNLIAQY